MTENAFSAKSSRPPLAVLWFVPLVIALDQISKLALVHYMEQRDRDPIALLDPFLRFTYIHNKGAAFGLDLGSTMVHTVVSVVALAILIRLFWSMPRQPRLLRCALALVLGGAVGNIIDRIRLDEGVIDFIDVGISDQWRWPIFNVADSFVTIGIILLAIGYARQKESEPSGDDS